jgi:hypothetical protein
MRLIVQDYALGSVAVINRSCAGVGVVTEANGVLRLLDERLLEIIVS